MKLSFNMIFQVLALVIQMGNQYSGIVPPKYQPVAALVVGIAQAAVAWRAHYFNPDGTPASVGYLKK